MLRSRTRISPRTIWHTHTLITQHRSLDATWPNLSRGGKQIMPARARPKYIPEAFSGIRYQKTSYDSCNLSTEQAKLESLAKNGCLNAPSYADITSVPKEQRQHPRRCSLSRNQKPPTLQRQCERKINFVENLVGKHLNPLPT